jgi:hypothetical protein
MIHHSRWCIGFVHQAVQAHCMKGNCGALSVYLSRDSDLLRSVYGFVCDLVCQQHVIISLCQVRSVCRVCGSNM